MPEIKKKEDRMKNESKKMRKMRKTRKPVDIHDSEFQPSTFLLGLRTKQNYFFHSASN